VRGINCSPQEFSLSIRSVFPFSQGREEFLNLTDVRSCCGSGRHSTEGHDQACSRHRGSNDSEASIAGQNLEGAKTTLSRLSAFSLHLVHYLRSCQPGKRACTRRPVAVGSGIANAGVMATPFGHRADGFKDVVRDFSLLLPADDHFSNRSFHRTQASWRAFLFPSLASGASPARMKPCPALS
jgi:hypothetical protein